MGGYKVSESRKPVSNLGVTVDDEDNEVWVLDTWKYAKSERSRVPVRASSLSGHSGELNLNN